MTPASRAECEDLDRADPLGRFRSEFDLPAGLIYLDGNSLGAMPRNVTAALQKVAAEEWARGLIRSWNHAGWVDAGTRVGAKIARLLGAAEDEVVVADSTSINLYKAIGAAIQAGHDGWVLTDEGNFPTDLYVVEAAVRQFGAKGLRLVPRERLREEIRSDVDLVTASHVDYRTGHMLDMAELTEAAGAAGALFVWDLCHSAGAVPVDLAEAGVDLAVGCTYKYLNGGPGSPAFIHVSSRFQDRLRSPIPGWFGHQDTFAFGSEYAPAGGARRFQAGTPGILGLAGLEVAVDLWLDVDMATARAKSVALSELLIDRVGERCAPHGVGLASPRDPALRGSHVSLTHPDAHGVVQALGAAGVIADHRPPDLVRLGLTPLYTRFVDVWDAIEILAEVLDSQTYREAAFAVRERVP
jgi:kynureninase